MARCARSFAHLELGEFWCSALLALELPKGVETDLEGPSPLRARRQLEAQEGARGRTSLGAKERHSERLPLSREQSPELQSRLKPRRPPYYTGRRCRRGGRGRACQNGSPIERRREELQPIRQGH